MCFCQAYLRKKKNIKNILYLSSILISVFFSLFSTSTFANENTKKCQSSFQETQNKSRSKEQEDLRSSIEIDHSLEQQIEYVFKDPSLRTVNVTYNPPKSNARYYSREGKQLDFLGDAVFNLSVSDVFFSLYPHAPHQPLHLISNANQADVMLSFTIDESILPNFNNLQTQPLSHSKRYLATFLEALVGLVYLDGGYIEARKLVERLMKEKIVIYQEEGDRKKNLTGVNSNTPPVNEREITLSDLSLHNPDTRGRLQSLGHHVLSLHITEILMLQFPQDTSDILTHKRSALINAIQHSTLSNLNKSSFSMYFEIEELSLLRDKPKRTLIFLLGIIYLVEGYEKTRVLVDRVVEQLRVERYSGIDNKKLLHNFAKGQFQTTPKYKIAKEGTGYGSEFIVEIWIKEQMLGKGRSTSRKRATKSAETMALMELGLLLK